MSDWWNTQQPTSPDWWLTKQPTSPDWWRDGSIDGPVASTIDNYFRPASSDQYLRPDGISLFKRP